MGLSLFTAANQWASRPDDERFWTLDEMYQATRAYAQASAVSKPVPYSDLRVEASESEIQLVGRTGVPAKLTHYAFGQLAGLAKSPAGFLRELPATLAGQVLNNRLKAREETGFDARILFHKNGSLVARSITSEVYDRVWNYEILGRLAGLNGWRVPPGRPANGSRARPATKDDLIPGQSNFGLAIREGEMIGPSGLYASDHDMFAFLVNPERTLSVLGRSLMRGLFVRNSEVGDGSLWFTWFLLDNVCGNHICWGVENVQEIRMRHVKGREENRGKTLAKALRRFAVELRKYEQSGAGLQEERLEKATRFEIAATKEEVLDALVAYTKRFGLARLGRGLLAEAYEIADERSDLYGSPRTPFGIVSGLTQASQKTAYADERNEIDVQAGRIMEMAF